MKPDLKRVFTDLRFLLAFGFGSGLSPKAPGTVGSLVGVCIFLAIQSIALLWYLAVVIGVFVAGVFICDYVAREMSIKDPACIVLDEFVGLWVALILVPSGWYWILAGFLLFRLFDITKPWPVGWLDKHLEGGLGIMADDVAAGLYALAVVQLSAIAISTWVN